MSQADVKSRAPLSRLLSYSFGASMALGLLAGCANPSMESAVASVDGVLASLQGGLEKLQTMEREAMKVQGPEGKRIKDTPLHQLFAKHPIDGSKPSPAFHGEKWYPRVALIPVTVPFEHNSPFGSRPSRTDKNVTLMNISPRDEKHERMCWTYRAKIWDSATKSRDVPEFLYCMDEADSLVRIGGAPRVTNLSRLWVSRTQSGSQFTTGPKQPKQAASEKYISSSHVLLRTYGFWNMMGMMTAMGLDPYDLDEGNRVWWADNAFTVKDFYTVKN